MMVILIKILMNDDDINDKWWFNDDIDYDIDDWW